MFDQKKNILVKHNPLHQEKITLIFYLWNSLVSKTQMQIWEH